MKLVSVVTVVFNNAALLEQTIASVIKLKSPLIEYVIVDGNSTDGTIDIIKKHNEEIDYWISEPDKGIYDAMNKGVALATGKFICFINCGDILMDIPTNTLEHETAAELVCFPIEVTGNKTRLPEINWKITLSNTLPHQGIFYRKSSRLTYDIHFKVFADYALNLDYYRSKKNIVVHSTPVVAFHSLDGISNKKESGQEIFAVIKAKLGIASMALSYLYFKARGLYYRF